MSIYLQDNIIFAFWTGKNRMSRDRKACLAGIEKNTRCTLRLVTPRNLRDYILDGYPLHPAYNYLSTNHRSDYLRCYFMHHHGGGYVDIKQINHRWDTCFEILRKEPDLFAVGYPEIGPDGVAPFAKNTPVLMKNHDKLIGNCAFIFRPNTEFTRLWHAAQNDLLDHHLAALKKNPARFPLDHFDAPSPYRLLRRYNLGRSKYSIRWTGLQGDLFHPLCFEYTDRINNQLPPPDFSVAYR